MNNYDKVYFESYAMLSICHIQSLEVGGFILHTDKPDLQSEKYDLGIEVTQAITKHDGLSNRIINQFFGKGLDGKYIVDQVNKNKEKRKFRGRAYTKNGVAVISPSCGLYDTSKHKELLLNAIAEKSEKFSGYKKYNKNGLYCFIRSSLIDSGQYKEIEMVCESSPIQIVFINCIDRIIKWEKSSSPNNFVEYNIEDELLRKWDKDAKNLHS